MSGNVATAHASSLFQVPLQEPEAAYTWKIANFTRKLARAKSDYDYGEMETEPFFSSQGYKMKVMVYLNEGPGGRSGYMGIYLNLMEGDRDGTLSWLFIKKTTFILVDQQDDIAQRQNIEYIMIPQGKSSLKDQDNARIAFGGRMNLSSIQLFELVNTSETCVLHVSLLRFPVVEILGLQFLYLSLKVL